MLIEMLATRRPIMKRRVIRRVITCERQHAFTWIATVTHNEGSASWTERVTFRVLPTKPVIVPGTVMVRVSDTDFPADRQRIVSMPKDSDMRLWVGAFLVSGRW